MNEIAIKRHNFDLAKNRLKEFSEKTKAELEIDKVPVNGTWLKFTGHNVTGDEFNSRLEVIQGHFIDVNTTNNKVIKEFREVYNALDALDKEYITSIVANVRAIEKTSNDIRVQQGILEQQNEKLANQQSKLDAHQVQIKKNVDNNSKIVSELNAHQAQIKKNVDNNSKIVSELNAHQAQIKENVDNNSKIVSELNAHQAQIKENIDNNSKIVTVLKVFKEKLEGYKHLTEIDKIWNDCKSIQNEIRVVTDNITMLSKQAREDIAAANNKNKALAEQVNRDILTLRKEIDFFNTVLNAYTHLQDIDNMWDDLDDVKTNIKKINENIQINQNELDTLAATSSEYKESIDTLSKNLADIEEYAANSRNLITELEVFMAKLSTLNHLMEVDKIWKQTEEHQLRINRVEQDGKSYADKLNELMQVNDRMSESISLNARDINSLKEYQGKLSTISHLDDVDSIWKDVEEHRSQLIEREKRDEELFATIQKNKDEVDKNIADAVQTANAVVESLSKKVKYAYWIAGGSAGLAIIELILLFMKVR